MMQNNIQKMNKLKKIFISLTCFGITFLTLTVTTNVKAETPAPAATSQSSFGIGAVTKYLDNVLNSFKFEVKPVNLKLATITFVGAEQDSDQYGLEPVYTKKEIFPGDSVKYHVVYTISPNPINDLEIKIIYPNFALFKGESGALSVNTTDDPAMHTISWKIPYLAQVLAGSGTKIEGDFIIKLNDAIDFLITTCDISEQISGNIDGQVHIIYSTPASNDISEKLSGKFEVNSSVTDKFPVSGVTIQTFNSYGQMAITDHIRTDKDGKYSFAIRRSQLGFEDNMIRKIRLKVDYNTCDDDKSEKRRLSIISTDNAPLSFFTKPIVIKDTKETVSDLLLSSVKSTPASTDFEVYQGVRGTDEIRAQIQTAAAIWRNLYNIANDIDKDTNISVADRSNPLTIEFVNVDSTATYSIRTIRIGKNDWKMKDSDWMIGSTELHEFGHVIYWYLHRTERESASKNGVNSGMILPLEKIIDPWNGSLVLNHNDILTDNSADALDEGFADLLGGDFGIDAITPVFAGFYPNYRSSSLTPIDNGYIDLQVVEEAAVNQYLLYLIKGGSIPAQKWGGSAVSIPIQNQEAQISRAITILTKVFKDGGANHNQNFYDFYQAVQDNGLLDKETNKNLAIALGFFTDQNCNWKYDEGEPVGYFAHNQGVSGRIKFQFIGTDNNWTSQNISFFFGGRPWRDDLAGYQKVLTDLGARTVSTTNITNENAFNNSNNLVISNGSSVGNNTNHTALSNVVTESSTPLSIGLSAKVGQASFSSSYASTPPPQEGSYLKLALANPNQPVSLVIKYEYAPPFGSYSTQSTITVSNGLIPIKFPAEMFLSRLIVSLADAGSNTGKIVYAIDSNDYYTAIMQDIVPDAFAQLNLDINHPTEVKLSDWPADLVNPANYAPLDFVKIVNEKKLKAPITVLANAPQKGTTPSASITKPTTSSSNNSNNNSNNGANNITSKSTTIDPNIKYVQITNFTAPQTISILIDNKPVDSQKILSSTTTVSVLIPTNTKFGSHTITIQGNDTNETAKASFNQSLKLSNRVVLAILFVLITIIIFAFYLIKHKSVKKAIKHSKHTLVLIVAIFGFSGVTIVKAADPPPTTQITRKYIQLVPPRPSADGSVLYYMPNISTQSSNYYGTPETICFVQRLASNWAKASVDYGKLSTLLVDRLEDKDGKYVDGSNEDENGTSITVAPVSTDGKKTPILTHDSKNYDSKLANLFMKTIDQSWKEIKPGSENPEVAFSAPLEYGHINQPNEDDLNVAKKRSDYEDSWLIRLTPPTDDHDYLLGLKSVAKKLGTSVDSYHLFNQNTEKWIVIHNTVTEPGSGIPGIFYGFKPLISHFVVDGETIYQTLPLKRVSWGTGSFNQVSYSIEMVYIDPNVLMGDVIETTSDLVADLMLKDNIPLSRIISHQEVANGVTRDGRKLPLTDTSYPGGKIDPGYGNMDKLYGLLRARTDLKFHNLIDVKEKPAKVEA
jgi:hypothetical protein